MHSKSTRALLVLVAVFAMSAVAASSALAAGKPLVETKAATGITKSEATLNGVVDPNGAETKYHFEYGTSTAYGSSTPEVYVGSGTSNVEEIQKVAGLLADQGYDFRIVATNSNGTTDGSNEAFTTSGPKVPLAETGGVSAVTKSGATLNGVVNPNGVATKYYFEYGTTISYGKKTAETSAGSGTANLNESATISGLTAKTTYHFRIVAINANGTTDGADGTLYSEVGPEFKPVPTKKKFTGTAGESKWLFWDGSEEVTCAKSSVTGQLTGGQALGDLVITSSGCKSENSYKEICTVKSVGAKEGEIVSKSLGGELGTVATKEAATGVGLRFKPEGNQKWFLLQANQCDSEAAVYGTAAAEVASLSLSTKHQLVLEGAQGAMKIKEITLDSGITEKPELEFGKPVTIDADYTLTFEEAVEVT